MSRARSHALAGLAALVAGLVLAPARSEAQYCPCYSPGSAFNSYNCGVAASNGTNPTDAQWAGIFDLVSQGPSVWGSAGPAVSDIGQGCGKPEPNHNVPARFPCELLKAIAKVESGWRQFCVPTTPSDEKGGASRTIISFDCGYGVGQVTSGMHAGETPSFDRQKVASDPTYNLATGTQILASKWKATSCVGDNQPTIVEDWYVATWAYNGLAYVNNPNNPNYASNRGVYDPAVGDPAPYQEKVFGWIEHPSNGQWPSVALAYPNPANVGGSGSPPDLPEPDCASPTNCAAHRSVHTTMCGATNTGGAGGGGGAGASSTSSGLGGAGATAGAGPQAVGAGVTSGAGGAGGAGNPDDPSLHGTVCGCRVTSDEPPYEPVALALATLAALASRRRRRARR